jgi:hypothetical protein
MYKKPVDTATNMRLSQVNFKHNDHEVALVQRMFTNRTYNTQHIRVETQNKQPSLKVKLTGW